MARLSLKNTLSAAASAAALAAFSTTAFGHGLMVDPPARNAFCGYMEKPDQAVTPACVEAAQADANGMYQFMSVLTHDIGRMGGPSTNVCGFDSETWNGEATPWDNQLDWPTTTIGSGPLTITWDISWGPHYDDTEEFRYWITKPGFNYEVGGDLTWDDFESSPFCVLDYNDTSPGANPAVVADKANSLFHTTCNVPERSGRHIIYGEWGRNHFTYERFHGCMDVVINGSGNNGSSSSSSSSSSSNSSSSSSSSTSSSSSGVAASSSSSSSSSTSSSSSNSSSSSSSGGDGLGSLACDYVISNEWNTGFTAEVRLTNIGDTLINGWSVSWTYSDGSAITNSWNTALAGANPYTASNVSWNGNILPGQTVSFGMQGDKGSDSAELPQLQGDLCAQ